MSRRHSRQALRAHERVWLWARQAPKLSGVLMLLIPLYGWYVYWFLTVEPREARATGLLFVIPIAIVAAIWDLGKRGRR